MKRDPYNYSLAMSVMAMKEEGNIDPSLEEILSHYANGKPYPNSLVREAQSKQRLRAIQAIIRIETNALTCLVSERYYTGGYRENGVADIIEAKRCVPIGYKTRAWGFRFAQGKNDLIYQQSLRHHQRSASASTKRSLEREMQGVTEKLISKAQGRKDARETLLGVTPAAIEDVLGTLGNGDMPNSKAGK